MATGVYAVEIPESIVNSATAASYTIPANYYGIVRAFVSEGGTFSVGGVVVMTSSTIDTTWAASNFTGTAGGVLDATSGGSAKANTSTAHSRAISAIGGGIYKVPAGTTVVGSAGAGTSAYHIELYRMPGT